MFQVPRSRFLQILQWYFALFVSCFAAINSCHGKELRAIDFGLVADGITDDGPAIIKLLQAARQEKGTAITLVFPKNKTIFAASGTDRYLLSLRHTDQLTIEGNNSTFLLDSAIRFADLHFANRIIMKNLRVDFTTSMFVESTVTALNLKEQYIEVTSDEAAAIHGPTKEDGEQWFGGFIWCENGQHPKAARHLQVSHVEHLDASKVRIHCGDHSITKAMAATIKLGVTGFSAPRAGVSHRRGPGALFDIHDATNISLENIKIWGAPWFAFSIYRCEGLCRFFDVDVVPKPDSARRMSACRDAFHVTANRAKLHFENCDTKGTGDDDYNFCLLSSKILQVISPTEIVIRQKFPIQYNPMRGGDTLMVMTPDNSLIGAAKISHYSEKPNNDGKSIIPGGNCPQVTIQLAQAIPGLMPGLTVWAKEASNPDTLMRHCTANFSNRIQTSITIEHCRFHCYSVCYGIATNQDNVEGCGPHFLHISHSEFHIGRGAGLVTQSGGKGPIHQTCIQKVHIAHCTFFAPLRIAKARSITLENNHFHSDVTIGEHETLVTTSNKQKGSPFPTKTKEK